MNAEIRQGEGGTARGQEAPPPAKAATLASDYPRTPTPTSNTEPPNRANTFETAGHCHPANDKEEEETDILVPPLDTTTATKTNRKIPATENQSTAAAPIVSATTTTMIGAPKKDNQGMKSPYNKGKATEPAVGVVMHNHRGTSSDSTTDVKTTSSSSSTVPAITTIPKNDFSKTPLQPRATATAPGVVAVSHNSETGIALAKSSTTTTTPTSIPTMLNERTDAAPITKNGLGKKSAKNRPRATNPGAVAVSHENKTSVAVADSNANPAANTISGGPSATFNVQSAAAPTTKVGLSKKNAKNKRPRATEPGVVAVSHDNETSAAGTESTTSNTTTPGMCNAPAAAAKTAKIGLSKKSAKNRPRVTQPGVVAVSYDNETSTSVAVIESATATASSRAMLHLSVAAAATAQKHGLGKTNNKNRARATQAGALAVSHDNKNSAAIAESTTTNSTAPATLDASVAAAAQKHGLGKTNAKNRARATRAGAVSVDIDTGTVATPIRTTGGTFPVTVASDNQEQQPASFDSTEIHAGLNPTEEVIQLNMQPLRLSPYRSNDDPLLRRQHHRQI